MRSLGILLTGLITAALLAAPATASEARIAPATKVVISGHGWGHGHGMSQYGARGAAIDGASYAKIVKFYYPGTALGSADGSIRVWISENTSRNLTVRAQSGLIVTGGGKTWQVAARHPHATSFRIVPVADSKDAIEYRAQGGDWQTMATTAAQLQFRAGNQPVTLVLPGGNREYRGALRSVAPDTSRRRWVVNVVSLESYVRGVVAAEMPASWPTAAVEAQAVASRTYAAYERAEGGHFYDICDTRACQVYGGVAAEKSAGTAAVRATAGRIVTYHGDPAFTQFASSNGGEMLAGSEPYLVSGKDPYEADSGDPLASWNKTVTVQQLMNTFGLRGGIDQISVQTVQGTDGAWVYTVTLDGTTKAGGSVTRVISAGSFVDAEGLYSANFSLSD